MAPTTPARSGYPDHISRRTNPTDHRRLRVLTVDECDELLEATPIGRVAFINAGQPVILPVTYAYRNRSIVFRTGIGAKCRPGRQR